MMMTINKFYPFLVWATTLLIGPFLSATVESFYFRVKEAFSDLTLVPIYWIFSLILSLPVLVIYCIIFYELGNKVAANKLRLILNIICIIGICITFTVIKGTMAVDFAIAYSISTIIASLFFRIMKKEGISNSDAIESP